MSAVAIIPARGGSRRIPRKNVRLFHGRPIIAYSIEAALGSHMFDDVVVSTDDRQIALVAFDCGAKVSYRDEKLCADDIGPLEVTAFTVKGLKPFEFACCIYATAPLMTALDIQRGFCTLIEMKAHYAISIYGADDQPITDAAQFIWATRRALINNEPLAGSRTALVPIAPNRVCDINTEEDWQRAERMYLELNKAAA